MALFERLLSKPLIFASAIISTACSSAPTVGPSLAALPELPSTDAPPLVLADCPSSPNCVSSVTTNAEKRVPAFELNELSVADFQNQLVTAIESDGGVVKDSRQGYLWATYTSTVFRFIDDIEWLYNAQSHQMDVRSASRTGYSDLGVNGKRVERLRRVLAPK